MFTGSVVTDTAASITSNFATAASTMVAMFLIDWRLTLLSLVANWTGLITGDEVTRPRPNTGFIWHPDQWSFVVALLAGAAGALALAVARSATMVGVFISVTTVPAAGNLALGLAFWDRHEIDGSLGQLGINIAGMVVAGAVVLVLMRWTWVPLTTWSERVFGRQADLADD